MTSPERSTTTSSPIWRPRRSISSSLWSVARETVTPPTSTGLRQATGVRAPVRPTWTSMASTVVVACRAGYLYAMAQRGALAVKPSWRCCSTESTLTTTPSMSYGRASRLPSQALRELEDFVYGLADFAMGVDLEAQMAQFLERAPMAVESGAAFGEQRSEEDT